MWPDFRHGVMWNATEMQNVMWTVVSWYVECYITQDFESYAVM